MSYYQTALRGALDSRKLADCTTKEGHRFTGEWEVEDGRVWCMVIDHEEREYQVDPDTDKPIVKPLGTFTQFIGTWTGREVSDYFAKPTTVNRGEQVSPLITRSRE